MSLPRYLKFDIHRVVTGNIYEFLGLLEVSSQELKALPDTESNGIILQYMFM